MALLALILVLFGFLVLSVGSIWFIVNAFRVSVLWGILVCLFTPAWIRFAFKNWDMARQPLCVTIVGAVLVFGGGRLVPADASGWSSNLAQLGAGEDEEDEPNKKKLPPMFAAQKEMELQLKLVALQKKETDLLDRKAALNPKDRQGAIALTAEINKYNAELKPLLQEMRDCGITTAAK